MNRMNLAELTDFIKQYINFTNQVYELGCILATVETENQPKPRGSITYERFELVDQNTINFTLDFYVCGESSYWEHMFNIHELFAQTDPKAYFRAELARREQERIEENKRQVRAELARREQERIKRQVDLERTLGVRD